MQTLRSPHEGEVGASVNARHPGPTLPWKLPSLGPSAPHAARPGRGRQARAMTTPLVGAQARVGPVNSAYARAHGAA